MSVFFAERWRRGDSTYARRKAAGVCVKCGGAIEPPVPTGSVHCQDCKLKGKLISRDYVLRREYGLTLAGAEALRLAQGGACAICRTTLDPFTIINGSGRVNWHVDHDHGTGAVRGVLCVSCNLGLGSFRDDPECLRAATDYLASPPAINAKDDEVA